MRSTLAASLMVPAALASAALAAPIVIQCSPNGVLVADVTIGGKPLSLGKGDQIADDHFGRRNFNPEPVADDGHPGLRKITQRTKRFFRTKFLYNFNGNDNSNCNIKNQLQ